jgi:hypothetical protein
VVRLLGNSRYTLTIIDNETPEGIIINEFGQGTGEREYVELVVTGTPGTTIDLRGWIIDDNSGIFGGGYGTQMGIAPGHLKIFRYLYMGKSAGWFYYFIIQCLQIKIH